MNVNVTAQVLCIISAINIQLCSVACLHICGRSNLCLDGGSNNSEIMKHKTAKLTSVSKDTVTKNK